jgi:hypothetical protein
VATLKCHLPLESEVNKAGQVDDANDLAEQKEGEVGSIGLYVRLIVPGLVACLRAQVRHRLL